MNMEVNLIRNHQNPPEIRQSRPRRDWMDASYKKHAYKCLPLSSANTHGWEVLLQQDITVVLDGPLDIPRVVDGQTIPHTHTQKGHTYVPEEPLEAKWSSEPVWERRWDNGPPEGWTEPVQDAPESSLVLEETQTEHLVLKETQTEHIYERDIAMPSIVGIISLAVDWVFNPPEGYSTMISGSPNYFLDGVVPLTAIIPGWWPDPFAMNWKITKLNTPITFPKGMPYMWFTFVKDDFLPEVRFNVQNQWDDTDLTDQRQVYGDAKAKNMVENPWTWTGGIRTGLLLGSESERVGPKFKGHPVLDVPTWEN